MPFLSEKEKAAQCYILYAMQRVSMYIAGNGPAPVKKGEGQRNESSRARKDRATERGDMMEYFLEKLNRSRKYAGLQPMNMPRMGRLLVAIPTQDLYYLKSVCDQSKDFSKKFWWEVNPKKHETKQPQKVSPLQPRSAPQEMRVLKRAPRSLD